MTEQMSEDQMFYETSLMVGLEGTLHLKEEYSSVSAFRSNIISSRSHEDSKDDIVSQKNQTRATTIIN